MGFIVNTNTFYVSSQLYSLGTLIPAFDVKIQQARHQLKKAYASPDLLEGSDNNALALERCIQLNNEINTLYDQEEEVYRPALPWAYHSMPFVNTPVRIMQGNNPVQEVFFKVQLNSQTDAKASVRKLISDLTKNVSDDFIPVIKYEITRVFESDVVKLWDRLFKDNQENSTTSIEIYASFILLDRIKSQALSIRKNSHLNEEVKNNTKDLYVVSDAYLGGVFLAHCMLFQSQTENGSIKASSLQVTNLGTISKIDPEDMDKTYENWKHELINDMNSGYPVAYKVQKLQDIIGNS